MDEHEFLITPRGDRLFRRDEGRQGEPDRPTAVRANGSYNDPEIMAVNLRTKKLVFSWNMATHVPLSDSMYPVPTTPGHPWDTYHVNSIDVSPDGSQLLVSARNTWGIYDISPVTGQVLWQIGGKQNQFTLPCRPDHRPIRLGVPVPARCALRARRDQPLRQRRPWRAALCRSLRSRARLDLEPRRPGPHGKSRKCASTYHDPALYPNSQGNLQVLANGDVFIGWGSDSQSDGTLSSYYTEYSSSGSVLADFVLAGQDISYRAFSHPWVGIPLTKPAAVVDRCERANDRVRLLERLDADGRLAVARRPHAAVAVAGLDHDRARASRRRSRPQPQGPSTRSRRSTPAAIS